MIDSMILKQLEIMKVTLVQAREDNELSSEDGPRLLRFQRAPQLVPEGLGYLEAFSLSAIGHVLCKFNLAE